MGTRRSRQRYQDILNACATIGSYLEGCTEEDWSRGGMRRDAIERQLLLIAEASAKLGEIAEQHIPNQPWADIRGLGNRLRHEYDAINSQLIWNLVTGDQLVGLAADVQTQLSNMGPDES